MKKSTEAVILVAALVGGVAFSVLVGWRLLVLIRNFVGRIG